MSQFDFPRINFHGQVSLDTPTANNGILEPKLSFFNQNKSEAYLPPRCYGDSFPPKYVVETDETGKTHVAIHDVNDQNFQQWAIAPLGSFTEDVYYHDLYESQNISGQIPGYWSYFGDLSFNTNGVIVSGITAPDKTGHIITYTQDNYHTCPEDLVDMIGAELSFKNNFFDEDSRTTAYMCDVDSIGQMCTQIFFGKAGLYKKNGKNKITYFNGSPCKATAHWMNLQKVLNWAKIVPMGGSATFFTVIELDSLYYQSNPFTKYSGAEVKKLLLRFIIHRVYEVRQPDYTKMPFQTTYDMIGNLVTIPKNPAKAFITGSISPWTFGDLKTNSLSRMMKGTNKIKISPSGIPLPVPKGSSTAIKLPDEVLLGNMPFKHNDVYNLISFDILNSINEYGKDMGDLPDYSGNGDVPPFLSFENYNFGSFSLFFQKDGPYEPILIGNFDFQNHYNMKLYIASGGMVDVPCSNISDYSQGFFYLVNESKTVMKEEEVYLTTDQHGIYAEQNQANTDVYMNDGLPKEPMLLRVLYRGLPVSKSNPVKITVQSLNMVEGSIKNEELVVCDKTNINFAVDHDGCMTYGFVSDQADLLLSFSHDLFDYIMKTSMVVLRVMSSEPQLGPYLNGQLPVTWDVIYKYIFRLYKLVYPAMDKILPFSEKVWNDPFILKKLLQLTDEENWNKPLYMPVTRDLSAAQRKLLQMWANQITVKIQTV